MTDQLPVKWEEILAKDAKAIVAQERPAVGRLSFRGGVIKYQGEFVPGNALNCIILAVAFEHALYENVLTGRAFNPTEPEPPICYALANMSPDGDKPTMAPHAQAPRKAHRECATCPYFAWGSDPKGGRGKACKEVRRMFLLGESAVKGSPDGVRKAEAAVASVPVTSVKNWANYAALLAGQYQLPPWAVITKLSVIPDAKSQFQVKFEPVAPLGREYYPEIYPRVQAAGPMLVAPYSPKAASAQPKQGVNY